MKIVSSYQHFLSGSQIKTATVVTYTARDANEFREAGKVKIKNQDKG